MKWSTAPSRADPVVVSPLCRWCPPQETSQPPPPTTSPNSYNMISTYCFNTLRPRQNGRHFPDDIFKCIFLNDNVWISIKISLKFVPKGPINNIPPLVQIMAWRLPGNKPLSELMMVSLPTHICITRPQRVKNEKNNAEDFNLLIFAAFELIQMFLSLCLSVCLVTSTMIHWNWWKQIGWKIIQMMLIYWLGDSVSSEGKFGLTLIPAWISNSLL